MDAQLIIQLPSLIDTETQIKPIRDLFLFKFTNGLQERLKSLALKELKRELSFNTR